jgi:acetyl esterase/lipase
MKIEQLPIYPALPNCSLTLYRHAENIPTVPPRRAVIVCPGGGYVNLSGREDEIVALQYAAAGFQVFLLHYGVGEHSANFAPLVQACSAIRYIREHAAELHVRPDRIFITGFSAGGHLAAHYSTMYNCKEVREVFPESKSVNASILSYPVITADFKYAHKGSFINLIGHEPESKEEQDYFSCDCQVDENTPPAFIWHTATDDCVPVKNSFLYAEALTKHKVPVELHIYPFGHHGMSTCDEHTLDNINEVTVHNHLWLTSVKNWLKLIFKN